MSLSWMICINMLIGIAAYVVSVVMMVLIYSKIFGSEVFNEAMDSIKKKADETYRTLVDDPRKMYVVSFIMTFLLWEMMLPVLFTAIWQTCKEIQKLHEFRNNESP